MVNILFYFFSFILIFSSLAIVTTYNSIISVLFLVLSFLISAILLILLECEFLALMLIIVYVGAVAVLFLFVVMMLETKIKNLNKAILVYFPFGVLLNSIFFFEIINSVSINFSFTSYLYNNYFINYDYISYFNQLNNSTDIQVFGHVLYTYFVLQFLIVGFVLFLVLVGVVFLTANPVYKNHKNQTVFYQLSRNSIIF
jgi:NADH-quinone oxidoreductase subunit J